VTPDDLGERGAALFCAIENSLSDGWSFDERERELLRLAAKQADDLEQLERAIAGGVIVSGSKGQPVLSGAVAEARQARLVIAELLGRLALPAHGGLRRSYRVDALVARREKRLGERRGSATQHRANGDGSDA
jgi:hypothetical protein